MPEGQAPLALPVTDARGWWVLAVVVAAQFMFVADVFIVNVTPLSIARI